MARKAKQPDAELAEAIKAGMATLDAKALAAALGDLLKRKAKPAASRRALPPLPSPADFAAAARQATPAAPRRAPRRVGRNQPYEVVSRYNSARYGTWRHYMIDAIVAHSSTRAAELAHAACDNPKFAKNRLDFRWAADNGFIKFI